MWISEHGWVKDALTCQTQIKALLIYFLEPYYLLLLLLLLLLLRPRLRLGPRKGQTGDGKLGSLLGRPGLQ